MTVYPLKPSFYAGGSTILTIWWEHHFHPVGPSDPFWPLKNPLEISLKIIAWTPSGPRIPPMLQNQRNLRKKSTPGGRLGQESVHGSKISEISQKITVWSPSGSGIPPGLQSQRNLNENQCLEAVWARNPGLEEIQCLEAIWARFHNQARNPAKVPQSVKSPLKISAWRPSGSGPLPGSKLTEIFLKSMAGGPLGQESLQRSKIVELPVKIKAQRPSGPGIPPRLQNV